MGLVAGTLDQIIHDQIADVFRTYDVIAKIKGYLQLLQNLALALMQSYTNFKTSSNVTENIQKARIEIQAEQTV